MERAFSLPRWTRAASRLKRDQRGDWAELAGCQERPTLQTIPTCVRQRRGLVWDWFCVCLCVWMCTHTQLVILCSNTQSGSSSLLSPLSTCLSTSSSSCFGSLCWMPMFESKLRNENWNSFLRWRGLTNGQRVYWLSVHVCSKDAPVTDARHPQLDPCDPSTNVPEARGVRGGK